VRVDDTIDLDTRVPSTGRRLVQVRTVAFDQLGI
jgi:hypothetical protein